VTFFIFFATSYVSQKKVLLTTISLFQKVENATAVLQGPGEEFFPPEYFAQQQGQGMHPEVSIIMNAPGLYSTESAEFTMAAFATPDFCVTYQTNNPYIGMVGAVVIIILTSICFALYDWLVRKEFDARQQLLAAKREFMRFISHEVRTPLNR
jgi:signal transduction histidine kinase